MSEDLTYATFAWLLSGAVGAVIILHEPIPAYGPFDEPQARALWLYVRTVLLGTLGGVLTLGLGLGRMFAQRH